MTVRIYHKLVFESIKRFKDWREDDAYDPHLGCPRTTKSDENIGKLDKVICYVLFKCLFL